MMTLPSSVKVYVAVEPVDMRKGFDGLGNIVRHQFKHDVLSGHLFAFFNRRRDRAKILFWDRSGFAIFYKRLEKGRFTVPDGFVSPVEMEPAELGLLLEGIDLRGAKKRERWVPTSK